MPDDRDIHRLPRGWCFSLVFTVVGSEFQVWVDEQIKLRNDKLAEENNKMILVEPSIAALFEESQNISSMSLFFSLHLTFVLLSYSKPWLQRDDAEVLEQTPQEQSGNSGCQVSGD